MNQEERHEQILLSLRKLDYLTREQVHRLHPFGSMRNIYRILDDMKPYLSTFSYERKYIYYLNREGRDRVGAKKVRKRTNKVKHYIMRNDLYIFLGRPMTWKNEAKIKNTKIVADAAFTKDRLPHFVEVDHKQTMKQNATKINKYRSLSEKGDFKLIWVTTTPLRKKRLEGMSEGLNVKIYTEDDLR